MEKYNLKSEQFKFKDAYHNPEFRSFYSMSATADSADGRVSVYCRETAYDYNRKIEEINFILILFFLLKYG